MVLVLEPEDLVRLWQAEVPTQEGLAVAAAEVEVVAPQALGEKPAEAAEDCRSHRQFGALAVRVLAAGHDREAAVDIAARRRRQLFRPEAGLVHQRPER